MLEKYPISTVNLLSKAAHINRIHDTVSLSGAVGAGAVHAIEAGWSQKTPKALRKYQESLLRAVKKLDQEKKERLKNDSGTLFNAFKGFGITEASGARHSNKS